MHGARTLLVLAKRQRGKERMRRSKREKRVRCWIGTKKFRNCFRILMIMRKEFRKRVMK